jgi:hypothetical protein
VNTPAYWDGKKWVVQSFAPLTEGQLQRIGKWLLKVQHQRRLGLSPGPTRDDLDASVTALRLGRIMCGLSPDYKDTSGQQFAAFKSTEGTGKIISLGAQ